MRKTNKERVLDYLRSIASDVATNSQIREATGIGSHQQVYMLTQDLMRQQVILGEQWGREWVFWIGESPSLDPTGGLSKNQRVVLDYLKSVAPEKRTNAEILKATGVSPHEQVFQITRRLMQKGLVRGTRESWEWTFSVEASGSETIDPSWAEADGDESAGRRLTPTAFESLARRVMSKRLGVPLRARTVPGIPKQFDMVSPDRSIVGDAKYYTLVGRTRLPPAKFSVIAEHVWLLERTGAPTTFLVFGNQKEVPILWLRKYGHLVSSVAFYFLSDDGVLERLPLRPD